MPPLTCPNCRRTNPAGANFCYFDGQMLRLAGAPAGVDPRLLAREFVFPSGRICRTLEDFVHGCQQEWEDARALLKAGSLASYLDGIGRPDLGRAARETQGEPDPDTALYDFLQSLPAAPNQGPRLDLHPRRIGLPGMRAGETRHVTFAVNNLGRGFLLGKIMVRDGDPWLLLGEGTISSPVKTAKNQEVAVKVDARGLTAGRSYSGRLMAVTNGGIAEVPVRLDLESVPFPRQPYQGAASPRDLAARIRANPKPAIPFLEGGEIARWFEANGWTYPIPGASAKGLAAVQQFFEYLGLSKPPALQLSSEKIRFSCIPPEVRRGEVVLRTEAKKWVYGRLDSRVPWLRVVTPDVYGAREATLAFEVDSSRVKGMETGTLEVTANGGQKLTIQVTAEVPRPVRSRPGGRLLRSVLSGALAFLVLRLFLAGPADLFARLMAQRGAATSLERWLHPALTEEGFLRLFVLSTWWLGSVAGLYWTWRKGGRLSDLFCGMVAGAVAGLMVAATMGCILSVVDGLPRALVPSLRSWVSPGANRWVVAAVWIGLAGLCWASLGAVLGILVGGLRAGAALFKPR